jgi:hypothetical protein
VDSAGQDCGLCRPSGHARSSRRLADVPEYPRQKEIPSWTLPASGVDFADDLHVRFFCRIRRLVKVVPWTLAEQSNYTEQILLQIA